MQYRLVALPAAFSVANDLMVEDQDGRFYLLDPGTEQLTALDPTEADLLIGFYEPHHDRIWHNEAELRGMVRWAEPRAHVRGADEMLEVSLPASHGFVLDEATTTGRLLAWDSVVLDQYDHSAFLLCTETDEYLVRDVMTLRTHDGTVVFDDSVSRTAEAARAIYDALRVKVVHDVEAFGDRAA